ncbi:MAG: OmpA family protein [Cytophagales bacterium]|nr:OmpA family protein [Cytophagales bacterium]
MKVALYILFIIVVVPLYAQTTFEWADKVVYKPNEYVVYEDNYPEMIIGFPKVYPKDNLDTPLPDDFCEGYILYKNKLKNNTIDFYFKKVIPAKQLIVGGVLNDGVIKKVYVQLKDKSYKQVYTYKGDNNRQKYVNTYIPIGLETVYGIRIVLDHSKVNQWNLIKGVGIYNGTDKVSLLPNTDSTLIFYKDKTMLPATINSKNAYEFNPIIAIDNSRMYFVREENGKNNQEIYYSDYNASTKSWQEAVNIGKPLNNAGTNFVCGISPNLERVYVGNTYKPNGEIADMGLSVSAIDNDGSWSIPTEVKIPRLHNNKSDFENYCINTNENVVIISMQDSDSEGDRDLYVSLYNKIKKTWEPPIDMGLSINSEQAEDFPYIASDDSTLYFASNGHEGYGGFDIFMVKRLDDTWTKWSKPINLGAKVNSKTDDFGFYISGTGTEAYFNTVTIDSAKNDIDIYSINIPRKLHQKGYVLVKATLLSARDQKPVKGILRYKNQNDKSYNYPTVYNNDKGIYTFALKRGEKYDIVMEAPNYFKVTDKIDLTDTTILARYIKKYAIEPYLDSGQVSVLSNLLFEFGTSAIKDSTSYIELNKLATQLAQQNKSVIEISGHTDDIGADEFNLSLSQHRATSVVEYLVSHGVRPWRLKPKGYGEQVPIAPNDSEDGRKLNRRVEMTILKDDISKKYSKTNHKK